MGKTTKQSDFPSQGWSADTFEVHAETLSYFALASLLTCGLTAPGMVLYYSACLFKKVTRASCAGVLFGLICCLGYVGAWRFLQVDPRQDDLDLRGIARLYFAFAIPAIGISAGVLSSWDARLSRKAAFKDQERMP